jgi:hypothetical protein
LTPIDIDKLTEQIYIGRQAANFGLRRKQYDMITANTKKTNER